MKKLIAAIGLAVALTGCASGARVGAMTADTSPTTIVAPDSPLKKSITVGSVTGGTGTNPLWKSEVGNPEFEQALRQSLDLNTFLASADGRYRLDVTLVDLDQPLFGGFSMTVGSTVKYVLTETATSKPAFDQTIKAEYTATVGDAFVGVERLRLANEGSIKKNLSLFMEALVQTFKSPAKLQDAPTS